MNTYSGPIFDDSTMTGDGTTADTRSTSGDDTSDFFDHMQSTYDELRRRLNQLFDEFYEATKDLKEGVHAIWPAQKRHQPKIQSRIMECWPVDDLGVETLARPPPDKVT